MVEQKKGPQRTGNETEKTVHDLTKQEDLTRVLDQSLRALQEMEQRLQVLEQEIGSIGARPGQTQHQRLQPGATSGAQYIGAPNPHGLYHQPGAANPLFAQNPSAVWNPGASAAWAQQQPHQQHPHHDLAFAQHLLSAQSGAHPLAAVASDPLLQNTQSVAGYGSQHNILGMGASPEAQAGGGSATTGTPGGTGGPVSEAMQVGQPGMMPEGGTRTKDFSEMTPQVRQPSMDVVDCNTEFLIHWELPGVKKDNLDIMVTDKSLILNAKALPELDDGIVVHSERPPVVYRRTIPFQTDVDTAKAKANLKDGVLTIHVPKRSPSNGPKRLDVAYG